MSVIVRRLGAVTAAGAVFLVGATLLAQARPPAPGTRQFPLPTDAREYQTFDQRR